MLEYKWISCNCQFLNYVFQYETSSTAASNYLVQLLRHYLPVLMISQWSSNDDRNSNSNWLKQFTYPSQEICSYHLLPPQTFVITSTWLFSYNAHHQIPPSIICLFVFICPPPFSSHFITHLPISREKISPFVSPPFKGRMAFRACHLLTLRFIALMGSAFRQYRKQDAFSRQSFPADFVFGSATSAYQVLFSAYKLSMKCTDYPLTTLVVFRSRVLLVKAVGVQAYGILSPGSIQACLS